MGRDTRRVTVRTILLALGVLAIATAVVVSPAPARQQVSHPAAFCEPYVNYLDRITRTEFLYPKAIEWSFYPSIANLTTQQATETIRSGQYAFPPLSAMETSGWVNNTVTLEGVTIGGTCWDDFQKVTASGDTVWSHNVVLGSPQGGTLRHNYNVETAGGGGGGGTGGGGPRDSYEVCYYLVDVDAAGNIVWDTAISLGCQLYAS